MKALINLTDAKEVIRLEAPLDCIQYIVLVDGTLYTNGLYSCAAPSLTEKEIEDYLKGINLQEVS